MACKRVQVSRVEERAVQIPHGHVCVSREKSCLPGLPSLPCLHGCLRRQRCQAEEFPCGVINTQAGRWVGGKGRARTCLSELRHAKNLIRAGWGKGRMQSPREHGEILVIVKSLLVRSWEGKRKGHTGRGLRLIFSLASMGGERNEVNCQLRAPGLYSSLLECVSSLHPHL